MLSFGFNSETLVTINMSSIKSAIKTLSTSARMLADKHKLQESQALLKERISHDSQDSENESMILVPTKEIRTANGMIISDNRIASH